MYSSFFNPPINIVSPFLILIVVSILLPTFEPPSELYVPLSSDSSLLTFNLKLLISIKTFKITQPSFLMVGVAFKIIPASLNIGVVITLLVSSSSSLCSPTITSSATLKLPLPHLKQV